MNKLKKDICLVLTVTAFAASVYGCSMSEFFNENSDNGSEHVVNVTEDPFRPDVNQLVSGNDYSLMSEDDEMLFETVPADENISSGTCPVLYSSDNTALSEMNDQGTDGDRIAGDGIYSCTYNVRSDDGKEQSYYVQSGEDKTNEVAIKYFDEITPDEVNEVKEVNSQISDIVSGFSDENGNVLDCASAFAAVSDYTKKLYESGQVVDYVSDDISQTVWMKLKSGISCSYENYVEGTDGGGDDVEIQIKTFQPFKEHYLTYRDYDVYSKLMKYPDDAATTIDKKFKCSSFSSSDNFDDSEVTVNDIVSEFSENSVIIWHGHGGFNAKYGSKIGTGTIFSNETYPNDSDLIRDYFIVEFNVKGECRVGLTYKYFENYCNDMTNSFVYLGACSSMKDTRLCTVFLNKGASAVIGNDNTINSEYNLKMIKSFCKGMTKKNGFFKDYKSAKDALDYAYKEIGDPPDVKEGEELVDGGKPVLIGNGNYRIQDSGEKSESAESSESSGASGKSLAIEKSYISVQEGKTASINIKSFPDGYDKDDLVWSSEKTDIATVSDGTVTGNGKGSTVIHVATSDKQYNAFCAITVN